MNEGKNIKSEKTRQFIIEKTAPIFNMKGYAGTSISDLTDATGLTRGSIYGNFKNKDEVAIQAFRYNVDQIISSIRSELKKAPTYFDKLMVYPEFYRNIYKSISSFGGCPIINTLVESDDTHEDLRKNALQIINMWNRTISEIVTKGKKSGEFKNDADPDAIADLVISLVEGSVEMTKATGRETYILNAMNHLEQVIISIKT
jgi:AcrR family transcriptional regulator